MTTYYLKQLFSHTALFQNLLKFETPEIFKDENDCVIDLNEVVVNGWIGTIRFQRSGSLAFIVLNDGFSESLQITAKRSTLGNEVFKDINLLSRGCAAQFSGRLVKSPSNSQPFELDCKNIKIYGQPHNSKTYPLAKTGKKNRLTLDHIRKFPHLRARTRTGAAVFRLRDVLKMATHKFFHNHDFIEVTPPTITASDCEGAGEMFKIVTQNARNTTQNDDFFGQPAFLTVSRQIDLEPYALAMRAVYCFGPTFRAEKSKTTRHLAEFEMVEPEICFVDCEELMTIAENYVKFAIQTALDECKSDVELLSQVAKYQHHGVVESTKNTVILTKQKFVENLNNIVKEPFARITYSTAIVILLNSKKQFKNDVFWGKREWL